MVCAHAGCATWSTRGDLSDKSPVDVELPKLRESRKAVIVEVEFVPLQQPGLTPQLASSDSEITVIDYRNALWQWADQTSFDSSVRRQLLSNGVQVGRVTNVEKFDEALKEHQSEDLDAPEEFFREAAVASELGASNRRYRMRFGRRYELPLRDPIKGEVAGLLRSGDQTIGQTLVNPTFLFAVTPNRTSSVEKVRLEIRPEVQHGIHRQTFVSSDSALRIDSKRDVWKLSEMNVDLEGSVGDTFIFGCTETTAGLGKQMFTGQDAAGRDQQLLLVLRIKNIPLPVDTL